MEAWTKGFAHQRGPITDYMGEGPDGLALCVCKHGKEWPEGDAIEPEGKACAECVQEWYREWLAANP